VQPQQAEAPATVSLTDVLAAPGEALLVAAADLAKAALVPATGVDAHVAAIDRKLAEEDELRRSNSGNWI
jgi:hypothetical protein